MKQIILLSLIAFQTIASAKLPVLICQSKQEVEGWTGTGTHEDLLFTAYIGKQNSLVKAVVKGAYYSDMMTLNVVSKHSTDKELTYTSLEDAWNWFVPVMPKNFSQLEGQFNAFIDVHGEEGWGSQRVEISCFVKK